MLIGGKRVKVQDHLKQNSTLPKKMYVRTKCRTWFNLCIVLAEKKKSENTDADNRNETKYWIQLTMSNTIIRGMLLPVCKGRFYKPTTSHCSSLMSLKGLPSFATASSVWLLHMAVIHWSVTSTQMYTSTAALHLLTPDAPLRKEHSYLTFSTKTTTRGAFSQL